MSNEQTRIIKEWEALQAQIREHDAKASYHAKLARDLSGEAEKLLRSYAGLLAQELGVTKGSIYERCDDNSRWQVSHAFPVKMELDGERIISVHIYMHGMTKTGKVKRTQSAPLLQQLVASDKLPPINAPIMVRYRLVEQGA